MNRFRSIASSRQLGAAGFSLIELMIVIAIIGLLAAVAVPSYGNYVKRGKRAEGRNALLDIAARQERFYSDNGQYSASFGTGTSDIKYADPAACAGTAGVQTETCKYTLAITQPGGNQTFTITAAPTFDDPECDDLTLTNTGGKGEGGTSDVPTCWGK